MEITSSTFKILLIIIASMAQNFIHFSDIHKSQILMWDKCKNITFVYFTLEIFLFVKSQGRNNSKY